MNARETTPVMLMQTVLTPKVRTTAPVKKGTKEMEEIVQVCDAKFVVILDISYLTERILAV